MAESNKMKEMPVNKLMVQMGIPMILSMALQAVYNIVDSAFVGNMRVDHGIIGSSDMDEAGRLVAKIKSSMVVPFMYKMIHTGALPKFMQKKLNKTDEVKKELYNGFLNMFGIGKGGNPWITKQSIYNQFYSDLVTKVQHGIDVPGTTIHVFYATKMGRKYEKRYWTYFKNPDIRRHNMQHEELFCCHSAEWVEEVRKAVEGDKQ